MTASSCCHSHLLKNASVKRNFSPSSLWSPGPASDFPSHIKSHNSLLRTISAEHGLEKKGKADRFVVLDVVFFFQLVVVMMCI